MKQKFPFRRECPVSQLRVLLLAIVSFLMLGSNVLAAGVLTQARPITVTIKKTTLNNVLNQIKDQSGVKILFNVNSVKNIECEEITFNNTPVEEALKTALKGTGFGYQEVDGVVVIKEVPQPQEPQKPADVKGKVIDATGLPLPATAIMIKGTKIGFVTDDNGNFSFTLRNPKGAILVFSFLGMKTQEIPYKGEAFLNIKMEDDPNLINEVVVTGIFNRDINTFTGSSTTVKADEIQAFGNRNILTSLRNIDPAFNIVESNTFGSDPNRLPEIQIRGNSNLPNVNQLQDENRFGMNTPLIILDGFQSTLRKLLDINENEVETITLLKDASATAIYGSRGANGVIVITTKAPEMGKLKIFYKGDGNIELPDLSGYNRLNAREKLELEKMVGVYETARAESDVPLKRYYNDVLNEVNSGVNTDWMSKPLRAGVGQRHNIRLEGGDKTFRYSASAQINNIQGVMKESDRTVFNGTIKLSYTYNKVKFTNTLMVGISNNSNSPYGSFSEYARLNPYWRAYDENGKVLKTLGYYGNFDYSSYMSPLPTSPLYNATLNTFDRGQTSEITNNTSIEWSITGDLIMRARLGLTKINGQTHNFKPADHTAFANYSEADMFRKGNYNFGVSNSFSYDGSLNLSYSKLFNQVHSIYAGVDMNISENQNSIYGILAEGFLNPNFDFLSMALQYAKDGKPSGSESFNRAIGFTGSLNYTYDSKYNFEFSGRTDGSSQFGSNKRFAPFWSAGIGWIATKEEFLKNVKFIDRLKFRASLGTNGHQNFSSYQALSTYRYYTADRYYSWLGSYMLGLGNPDLKWQQKMNYNVGVEASFLKNRLSIVADVYLEKVNDLVSSVDLPASNGFTSYIENIGTMENRGFEFKATAVVVKKKDLSWSITGAITHNKNTIVEISQALKDAQKSIELAAGANPNFLYKEGYSTNAIWVVPSLGIDPSTGKELYLKKDGTPTFTWSALDLQAVGIAEPKYYGNLNTSLRYKALSVNLSFGYRFGGQQYNQTLINLVENANYKWNVDRRVYDSRWQKPGDIAAFKGLLVTTATNKTSRFVQDENTFNCQNINVRYDIKSKRLQSIMRIEMISLAANMADIFYISSVKRERGTNYPFSRQISFTVGLTF
jgi:TonB-linked SusC/RagA family outer membrane protein